ncbi:MAG: hypothetical protein HY203_10075 [Nitrospirae bacterium]|nr:hypothetical protein [Nitrospirota bacterium]
MKMRAAKSTAILCCLIFLFTTGCATKPLPKIIYPRAIYPMNHYPMSAESSGLKVAAVPFSPGRDVYADPAQPINEQTSLPLNVLEAGVLPVRLVVLNETEDEIVLDPDQITGMADSTSYRIYSSQEAVDLVVQSKVFKEAIKGSQVGPVVKSILGGEIIIGAVKSGVGGIASGGITGGASGAAKGAAGVGLERAQDYEKALIQLITQEYTGQAIKRQTLYPGFIADGLIFLPSNVKITELRIPAYDLNNKKAISLRMRLS